MITDLDQVREGRLTWPETKPRAAHRIASPFRGAEVEAESSEISRELARWGVKDYVISRNRDRIFAGDPGVALWWLDRKKQLRVLAADRYNTLAANLRAIHLTLYAMRALERWGAYSAEQAAEGAKLLALASPTAGPHWSEVIQVDRTWPLPAIEGMWRDAMKAAPDNARMAALNIAIEQARKEKRA